MNFFKAHHNNKQDIWFFLEDEAAHQALHTLEKTDPHLRLLIYKGNLVCAENKLKEEMVPPAILVVDLSKTSDPIAELRRLSSICSPSQAVIAIGNSNQKKMFREFVHLNIQDFIEKPVNIRHLRDAIRNILSPQQEGGFNGGKSIYHEGKIISFLGIKGGVGSSNLVASSAITISNKLRKKTALLDFSLYSPYAIRMRNAPLTLTEGAKDPGLLNLAFLEKFGKMASQHLLVMGLGDRIDMKNPYEMPFYQKLSEVMKSHFHFSVFDISLTSPHLLNVIAMSDILVLVIDQTQYSARNLRRFLDFLKQKHETLPYFVIANKLGRFPKEELPTEIFESIVKENISHTIPFYGTSKVSFLNQLKAKSLKENADYISELILGDVPRERTLSSRVLDYILMNS